MKIKISEKFWSLYVSSQPGRTQEAKETFAENIWSSPGRSWANSMLTLKGKWTDVDTEFVFENSFNAIGPNGLLHVDANYIEAIDFKPEFKNIDSFREAVQKRYDVDSMSQNAIHSDRPGRKINLVVKSHIKHGLVLDMTEA